MKKYYTDSRNRKFELKENKIDCIELYLCSIVIDDLKENLRGFIDEETKKLLELLSGRIHSLIPHLKCDNLVDSYIVEVGYDCKDEI